MSLLDLGKYMEWVNQFQLFLFDLDGLLVNTEELHYKAYQQMCSRRGVTLTWDFARYCQAAHYDSTALRDQIYRDFPALKAQEPNWSILYSEKKQAILDLINNGIVHLMPGVEHLLMALEKANIKRSVVTHSPDELVQAIRIHIPLLETIPNWMTRHDYAKPKPDPECYLKAIESLAKPGDNIIGFEDTPRGLSALMETQALPVIISSVNYPEIPSFLKKGARHFTSIDAIPSDWKSGIYTISHE